MSQLLAVENLRKVYKAGDGGTLEVLRGMSFSVDKGEVVAVVGESGAGKSTLLHMLGALDRPSEGTVRFDGEDIYLKDDEALARFRNRSIGFVFQFHHLLPEFTALENVAMPSLIQNKSLDQVQDRAASLLELLGLKERINHRPGQMSGGEKQRVAVARALMNEPGLILADEPTGNLDVKTAESLHHELIRLSRTFQQTFVIVTHNPSFAKMADRVLTIEEGQIKE
ncbi:MAG: ABC transporter ATP-binding protein [Rhodothermales bacterium]